MMRSVLFFFFLFFMMMPNVLLAAEIPLVERHLFSPEEPDAAGPPGGSEEPIPPEAEKKIDQDELNKKMRLAVQFFGVVISDEPKALLKDIAASRSQKDAVSLYKVGDTIGDFELIEIRSNAIRLKGLGGETDYRLFSADKKRPVRPPEPSKAVAATKDTKKRDKPKKAAPPKGNSAKTGKEEKAQSDEINTNPFLQALKKARERKAEMGETAPGANQTTLGENNPFKALIDQIQNQKQGN